MSFEAFLAPLKELENCSICPRDCHADRYSADLGYCKSDASFNIASICIHRGEEPVISGKKGICNIFFTNCNLQCLYCQNHQITDRTIDRVAYQMSLEEVITRITEILDLGINMVGFVSPSHFIPQMRVIRDVIHSLGYRPIWVFNTNGYDKVATIRALEGLIDVYLPDYKYRDLLLARNLSDVNDYPEVAAFALKEMYRQKGSSLILNEDGVAESGIVIRHLVLPGYVENSLEVLRFIANELSPRLHISLMSQYYPTPKVRFHNNLKRNITHTEYRKVIREMDSLGMYNGWLQEFTSTGHYAPDFRKKHPFEDFQEEQ